MPVAAARAAVVAVVGGSLRLRSAQARAARRIHRTIMASTGAQAQAAQAAKLDGAAAARARAAVLGSLLGDAATTPLHWLCALPAQGLRKDLRRLAVHHRALAAGAASSHALHPPSALPAPTDDLGKLDGLLADTGRAADPAFFPEPSCPFYSYPVGRLSPYGEHGGAAGQAGWRQPQHRPAGV